MAAYIPDATDVTVPISTTEAASAAAEFRALKLYIRDVILATLANKLDGAGGVINGNLKVNGTITGNGAGITNLVSQQIKDALGFTPYNAANPSGYLTSINGGMVATALGYVPYNSNNPSGYINSKSGVDSAVGFSIGTNAQGNKTISSNPPSGGGGAGDIWYQYIP